MTVRPRLVNRAKPRLRPLTSRSYDLIKLHVVPALGRSRLNR